MTVIQGQMPGVTNGYMRCVYLTNAATLVGFTLTNGVAGVGAGVYCESTSAVLSNCVLSGNSATNGSGGGAYGGTLNNCTLTGNSASWGGGGAESCALNNCALTGNSAYYDGGGADSSTLDNCMLTGNSASDAGGGASSCTLNDCTVTGNTNLGTIYSTLNNCVMSGNTGGGASGSTLNNCTVTGNSGWGASSATLNNCIVYFNSATNGGNYDPYSTLNYCCTTPMPTNGVGNITNTPLFVDQANGNLRLQTNSPCINAGNNAFVVGSTDLDGNPRTVSGTVDMGAYEFQGTGSVISYAWLQQYGLPTDGSADFSDPDHDGMNNWQEWRCGTCPTNANSALRLLSPQRTGTDVTVTWQSVAGVSYFLECSTNLSATPSFTCAATNLLGQPGTTSYTDTAATNAGPYFYRVGVGN
jgi:hypothetical protein